MAKNDNVRDFVKDIADALRAKKKSTEKINPQNFATEITNLTTDTEPILQPRDVVGQWLFGELPQGYVLLEFKDNGEFSMSTYLAPDFMSGTYIIEGSKINAVVDGVSQSILYDYEQDALYFEDATDQMYVRVEGTLRDKDLIGNWNGSFGNSFSFKDNGIVTITHQGTSNDYPYIRIGNNVIIENEEPIQFIYDETRDVLYMSILADYILMKVCAGGSGGAYNIKQTIDGDYCELHITDADGSVDVTTDEYVCRVVDYDGTILKEEYHNEGDTFTLPSQPSHEGLVFQEWSSPVDIVDNSVTVGNSDLIFGPTYTTESGLSEFYITLTKVTGLDVTLNMDGTKDWGDGTTDELTTHTYTSYGDYVIKCSGSTITSSESSGVFGQLNTAINNYCTEIRLGLNIETITGYAFQYCYSLTNITIPDNVTSIGDAAFKVCYSLTNITIPNNVTSIGDYAFADCSSLTNITIPDNVTSIGNSAFNPCYSLTNITIPDNVTSIGDYAFRDCRSLTNITIPNNVTSIGDAAFRNCYSLTNITISDNVTSIGNYAFDFCCALTNITIPNNVTSIGNSAFSSCNSLTNITISDNVTSIGDYAFQYCYSLTNITIPDNVTSIGNAAFADCYSLTNIIIPNNVISIGNSAFSSCYSLTNITISDNVTSIGNYAFDFCCALTNITIPANVTSIGTYAFRNCFSLTNITISDNVTSIGGYAFSSCYSLTNITIPANVTSIGGYAFRYCHSIVEYDFSNLQQIPTLSSTNAFIRINGLCKIIVPDALYDTWITATNWSTYADYIYKASEVTE